MSSSEADLISTLASVFFGTLWLIWMGRLFQAVTAPLRRRVPIPEADGLSLSDVQFLRSLRVQPWEQCSSRTHAVGDGK